MADGHVSYPSVFVVDGGTKFPPPLPPKPGQTRIQNRRTLRIQTGLLVLVCLALFGLLVEAYFIYKLYKAETSETTTQEPKIEAQKGEEKPVTKRPPTIQLPSKPLAHLSAGPKKPEKAGIMEWNLDGDSIIYGLEYRDGKLIVQKEGYYYVYSKLCYSADHFNFIQNVEKNTTRYLGNAIALLSYRRHDSKSAKSDNNSNKGTQNNSYLGGVFYLYKGDAVFVHVNNGSLVRLYQSADNFFGMFML